MLTGFIGRNLIFLPKIDSTNSYAMQLLKNVKPKEGTVVYAGHQTLGRGQRSKVWESEPERNITLSVILFPVFLELKNQRFLYEIAALACYDTIASVLDKSQFDIKIKWPNDILVNSKKVAGILIENNILDNKIQSTVIGIGMNVNQKKFEQQAYASSLGLLCQKEFDTKEIMAQLCNSIGVYYKLLKEEKISKIADLYQNLLFGLEEWREFTLKGKSVMLKVIGTSNYGFLLLEDLDGNIMEADTQELRWIF